MDSQPNLSHLDQASQPSPSSSLRFCVIGQTDAVEWEGLFSNLDPKDWPDCDLVKAPDEEWVEVYVYAADEAAARAAVERMATELGLPALEKIEIHDAGAADIDPAD